MKHKILTAVVFGGFLGMGVVLTPVSAQADAVTPEEIKNVTVGNTIPVSLTGKKGDAATGFKTSIHRKKGNCLACHTLPAPKEQFHGNIGPDLNGIASRMTEAEIRMQIVNPKVNNPDSIMPGFYIKDFPGTAKKFKGKTMLSAADIEDIVAYMMTLK